MILNESTIFWCLYLIISTSIVYILNYIIKFVIELNKYSNPYEKLAIIQSTNIDKMTKSLFDSICSVLKISNIEEFILFTIKTTLLHYNDNNRAVKEIIEYIN